MKILICGDRNWEHDEAIARVINDYHAFLGDSLIIISGGARGADSDAAWWAKNFFRIKLIEINANWKRYGNAAGPIRNREMLDLEPDIVLAFHNDIENSRGTKDCCREATKRGIPVDIFSYSI